MLGNITTKSVADLNAVIIHSIVLRCKHAKQVGNSLTFIQEAIGTANAGICQVRKGSSRNVAISEGFPFVLQTLAQTHDINKQLNDRRPWPTEKRIEGQTR